jgi:prolyl-tRNA synthetase
LQIIVGPRSVANGEVEVKNRRTGERETVTIEAAMNKVLG